MFHLRVVVVAVLALQSISSGAHAEHAKRPGDFFGKVGAGAGWASSSLSQTSEYGETATIELSGSVIAFEAALGLGVTQSLVLGVGYNGVIAPDASGNQSANQYEASEQDAGRFGAGLVGVAAFLYFDSQKHFYASSCVGVSYVDLGSDAATQSPTVAGPGISVGAGYDVWLAPRFAFGPRLWLLAAAGGGKKFDGRAEAAAVGVSATTF